MCLKKYFTTSHPIRSWNLLTICMRLFFTRTKLFTISVTRSLSSHTWLKVEKCRFQKISTNVKILRNLKNKKIMIILIALPATKTTIALMVVVIIFLIKTILNISFPTALDALTHSEIKQRKNHHENSNVPDQQNCKNYAWSSSRDRRQHEILGKKMQL